MFADGLRETHWTNRSRRGWTTLASFALQALWVAVLLILPLIYTEGLPQWQWVGTIAAPAPPPPPPPQGPRRPTTANQSNLIGNRRIQITAIPRGVHPVVATEPPPGNPTGVGVPGGTGEPGPVGTVPYALGPATVRPPMPKPSTYPPRISRMMEGSLIYRVQPSYPALAKATRIQGQVVLHAVISRSGTIESLQVISGHPLLVKAAIDAVRQWRYRPYILNGDPVDVDTEVTVNFVLSGG